jgi:hypothetical protein
MSRFVLNAFTVAMITFAALTLISVFLSSYTIYVYFGVCKTVRIITCDVNFTVSQGYMSNMSIKTDLTLKNPSAFDFLVTYVNEKFYLDSKLVGDSNGYWLPLQGGSIKLIASSNLDIVLNAPNIPVTEEQVVNLYTIIYIGLSTPLPDPVSLRFVETLQNSV